MSVFVNDTFTDTPGTTLASHTGETGATWTKHTSYTGTACISDVNTVRSNDASNVSEYYASGSPATAEYDVEADLIFVATDGTAFPVGGLMGRVATGADTRYIVWYQQNSGQWQLYKYVAGVQTQLGSSYTQSLTPGTPYHVKLQIRDATKKVFIDGVERISDTDNSITAAGKAGLILNGGASNAVGYQLDNFTATDAGGASLTAGTLSASSLRYNGGVFAVATNSGGTAPYSSQLQRSAAGAGSWSNVGSPVAGATPTLTDTTASQNTSYDYRFVVTDNVSATATSNTLSSQQTKSLIAANDSNVRYYGRWNAGSTAITINNGAEFDVAYTGDTCNLVFDVSGITAYPVVTTWIDNVGPTRTTLDSTARVAVTPAYNTAPTGTPPYATVSSNRHHLRVMANCDAGNGGANNWTNLEAAFKFVGVEVDPGAASLPLPSSPDRIEFLGDSITAGLRVLYTTGASDVPAINAPEINWPEYVARLLGLRAIVNGHGGQGITTTSTDGAPIANSAFPYVYNGVSWSPATPPLVVFVYQGTNDSSFTSGQYQTFLTTIRAGYPSAYIFACVPSTKTALVTPITAAVAAMADPKIFLLDYSTGVIDPADDTADSIGHLNPGGAVTLGAKAASDIRTQLTSSGVKMQAAGAGVLVGSSGLDGGIS